MIAPLVRNMSMVVVLLAAVSAAANSDLNKPGHWYTSTDCSGDGTYMPVLGAIPEGANSYKFDDEPEKCHRIEVVVVTGRPVDPPAWLPLRGYTYDRSWNIGMGDSYDDVTQFLLRGDQEPMLVPPSPTYYAGICPRELGPLPYRIGIVRHDDVVSKVENASTPARRSGYFAVSDTEAFEAAVADLDRWFRTGVKRYTLVQGYHKHLADGNCSSGVPVVAKSRVRPHPQRRRPYYMGQIPFAMVQLSALGGDSSE